MNIAHIRNAVLGAAVFLSTTFAVAMTPEEIISALKRAENSTGNIADAVEEVTGARGWMSSDMKPIYDNKIVGRAATALMRPVLRTDERKYRNHLLEILDEGCRGLVSVGAPLGQTFGQFAVMIPIAMVELNEPDTPFGETTRKKTVIGERPRLRRVGAVHGQNAGRFL